MQLNSLKSMLNFIKIGIDGRNLTSPLSGISRYIIEMSKSLSDRGHEIILYVPSDLHDSIPDIYWAKTRISKNRTGIGRLVWGQTILPLQAKQDKLDIFWGPAHRLPLLKIAGAKKILTIHDLVWRKAKKTMALTTYCGDRAFMPRSVLAADIIITDSNSTKNDLRELVSCSSDKSYVVYPGVNATFFNKHKKSDLLINNNRYLLFVGTLEPRKNLKRLLMAWSRVKPNLNFDYKLVIVGKSGWGEEDINKTAIDLGIHDSVVIKGFVSESELKDLYCHAKSLLMPSLYEGFGLPLLEAQACGIPVMTSKISSMPEVSGPDTVFVDPESIDSIYYGLKKILSSSWPKPGADYRAKLFAKQFSWDHSASEFEKLVDELNIRNNSY